MKQEIADIKRKLNDKNFRILFNNQEIAQKVRALGETISEDFKTSQELVVVAVLKGSFIFAADLIRNLTVPMRLEFMGVSSYSGKSSTGNIQVTNDFTTDIKGKDVLLVEDIIDTGETIDFLIHSLQKRGPKSVKIASLLSKPSKVKTLPFKIDYVGFSLNDEFVVGYGLDLDQHYRELPHLIEILD